MLWATPPNLVLIVRGLLMYSWGVFGAFNYSQIINFDSMTYCRLPPSRRTHPHAGNQQPVEGNQRNQGDLLQEPGLSEDEEQYLQTVSTHTPSQCMCDFHAQSINKTIGKS